MQLAEIYGQLWVSKHGAQDNGTWLETLRDLTPKALESGMERLRTLKAGEKFCDYPPNCLQFKALCLSFYDDLQLPAAGEAYREVKANLRLLNDSYWTHPVVRYTAAKMMEAFLSEENEALVFKSFRDAYSQVCLLAKQGHPIPDVSIDYPKKKLTNPKTAQMYLNKLREMLGVKN